LIAPFSNNNVFIAMSNKLGLYHPLASLDYMETPKHHIFDIMMSCPKKNCLKQHSSTGARL